MTSCTFLQLHPYHFAPLGLLHPITVLYELNYGETEMNQGTNESRPLDHYGKCLSTSLQHFL